MTTLYKPVKIRTRADSDALPEGAILLSFRPDGRIDEAARVKDLVFLDWEALGGHPVTALVPIEADAVRSEPYGVGHATERHAGGPFTAYYVHEETR